MRILHTADWHLGHTLRDVPREAEHERFLHWLLATVKAREIDALLIAGDVFHTANPPAAAQAAWYRFLAEARRRFPHLDIVVIGGNHDSAARLDAPVPLLDAVKIHVVGGLPRTESGEIDVERLLVPLTDRSGYVRAYVAAVPYLRSSDLPAAPGAPGSDALVDGVRRVYADVFEAARRKRWPGQALIAMGHCYMTGTTLSELSERKILGGNQHALPSDVFPETVAYAALGHLHLAQEVGRSNVRYSGSPIPLSMGEADYAHQVVLVEIDGDRFVSAEPVPVPRTVDLIRVPAEGPAPVEDVLMQLATLPPAGATAFPPFLEVAVRLERPDASVRRRIEEALEGRHARLVQIVVETYGSDIALGDALPDRQLQDLDPVEVFVKRYQRDHDGEPPDEMIAAFHELIDGLRSEEAA